MEHVVDFSVGDIIKVHHNDIMGFQCKARRNILHKRYRLCLHDTPENKLQEMMICMAKDEYVRPHRHDNMPESHTIIIGKEMIILFSDTGEIEDTFLLAQESGFISYRINANIYHTTIPLTDTVVEHEVKPGPFYQESNIYPNWAPKGIKSAEIEQYMHELKEKVINFLQEDVFAIGNRPI